MKVLSTLITIPFKEIGIICLAFFSQFASLVLSPFFIILFFLWFKISNK